ncbi:mevalonate kinase [Candidatus Woesebacteria bacterium]|nr:mevalonate kinase [Candidatus Woesebacteria bacterium]
MKSTLDNRTKIVVSVPGKIHLLGEHAVVYGKPAILTSINKRCTVTITPRKDTKIIITSKELDLSLTTSEDTILKNADDAHECWSQFVQNNDIALLKSITDHPLAYPSIAVGITCKYLKKRLPSGFSLDIQSDIPVGAGLGSSAALAVAIVAAVMRFLGEEPHKNIVNDIAYIVEQKMHGTPSGGDNAAVCYGGLIWFRKESPDFKIIQPLPFTLPTSLAENFILINTGKPTETTGELVSHVRSIHREKPEIIQKFLNEQEELTRQLIPVMKQNQVEALTSIIKQGQANLENIGVVSDFAKEIIRIIKHTGGAAKICGAGGVKKAAGIILAYHKSADNIHKIIRDYKLPAIPVTLGGEGLLIN